MESEDSKDTEKQNIFHIRIIYYLMENYPNKIKTIHEITKYFKKGNANEYSKARRNLIEWKHIINYPEGMQINPEREEYKIFIMGVEKNPSLPSQLKNKEKIYLKLLEKKENQKGIENLYKAVKK